MSETIMLTNSQLVAGKGVYLAGATAAEVGRDRGELERTIQAHALRNGQTFDVVEAVVTAILDGLANPAAAGEADVVQVSDGNGVQVLVTQDAATIFWPKV